uniref:Parvin, gamma n=1 Tax=Cyprinus carpio carpio TaxID=630221 RepID=A0A8C0YQ09_CYPCA
MADCGAEEEKGGSRQGGERRMMIQPTSLEDPKLNKLKEVLVEWINRTLKVEHIVVRTLEEDIYDGLVIHHLLRRLAGVQLHVEEIALSTDAQVRKLEVILTALNETLEINEETAKWSVKLIHSRDLLATLHLLVAMARRFQPDLVLPANVSVEVIQCEVTKSGVKADKQTEFITFQSNSSEALERESNKECPIDELFKLEAHKIETVKKAILHFVNKNMSSLGLGVTDLDKQFADGVILLLLIGQLEGFFIPLCEFFLCPVGSSEMLHNVTLALDLLIDRGLPVQSVDPQGNYFWTIQTLAVECVHCKQNHLRNSDLIRQHHFPAICLIYNSQHLKWIKKSSSSCPKTRSHFGFRTTLMKGFDALQMLISVYWVKLSVLNQTEWFNQTFLKKYIFKYSLLVIFNSYL